jgi:PAS domain S-box-containing protein
MIEDDHAAPVEVAMARAFRSAFGGAPTGMAIVDERGAIKTANAAMARITGFAEEELVGHPMLGLIEPDDRGDDVSSRRIANGDISAYDTRLRLRRADGSSAWVALNVIPDGELPPRSLIYQV